MLATGLDMIQKYSGTDSKPKLNKLNSVEWKNTKARVKGAVKEIARELWSFMQADRRGRDFSLVLILYGRRSSRKHFHMRNG